MSLIGSTRKLTPRAFNFFLSNTNKYAYCCILKIIAKQGSVKKLLKHDHSEMGMVNIFVCFLFREVFSVCLHVYILLYNVSP